MKKVSLRVHAKVNYALEVRGIRPDGYHEISTVMQSVSLADELEVESANEGFELRVEPEGAEIGPLKENTVFRAWKLLGEIMGHRFPARVRLRKKIPVGAGLGGGSADAAAALIGLDMLFGLGLSESELQKLGLRIGADVPFCLVGGTALGEGIGEVLTSLPAPPPHVLVVAKPAANADTAVIYRAYDEKPGGEHNSSEPAVEAIRAGDLHALARAVGNDLAPVAKALVPEVEELEKELLDVGALGAAMSGSGSAVYGIFGSEKEARATASKPRAPFIGVYEPVACGVELR